MKVSLKVAQMWQTPKKLVSFVRSGPRYWFFDVVTSAPSSPSAAFFEFLAGALAVSALASTFFSALSLYYLVNKRNLTILVYE